MVDNGIMIKKAYAYLRVSSEEQVSNFSLDNQYDYCKREAERQGYDLINVYREEGVSAKTINRPELLKLLEDCRKNKSEISAVYIYKIDRISRETYDFLAIKKRLAEYGIRIISVTEPTENNPTGEFLETLLAAVAKLDNATKGVRTKDGIRKRLEEGWATGKAPVGYLNLSRDNRQVIEPDTEQFELVKKSWEEMGTGAYSLASIVPFMNKLGVYINYGNNKIPITRDQQTQRIFRDKFYCGYVVSKVFNIDKIGKHIPMISEDLFYKVQSIINGRSFTNGIKHNRQNEIFPLRGVLCDKCGLPMTGSFSRGNGGKYAYYYCVSGKHHSPSIPKDDFETDFVVFLRYAEPKQELVKLFTEMVKEKWEIRYSHLANRYRSFEEEISALHEVRKRLVAKHLRGVYTDEIFNEQLELIEDELLVQKSQKSEAKLQEVDIDIVVNFMNDFLWNVDKAWLEGSLQQRRVLLGSIFPKNVVYTYPGFRTDALSPCFKLIKQFETVDPSLWVTDGTRTRNTRLHRAVLYH